MTPRPSLLTAMGSLLRFAHSVIHRKIAFCLHRLVLLVKLTHARRLVPDSYLPRCPRGRGEHFLLQRIERRNLRSAAQPVRDSGQ